MAGGVYGSNTQPMMIQVGADESLKGETVTFWINGVQAAETIPFDPGVTHELDLHVAGAPEQKLNIINQGYTVFIGEFGLDVSSFLNKGEIISWFEPASQVGQTEPAKTIIIDNPNRFNIKPSDFLYRTGNWYIGNTQEKIAFVVENPSIKLRVWNQNDKADIKKEGEVPVGDFLNFIIETNVWSAISQRGSSLPPEDCGIIDIVGNSTVTNEDYDELRGNLYTIPNSNIPLRNLVVDESVWFWPENDNEHSGWDTGALGSDQKRMYPNGKYQFFARITLNGILNNYPDDDQIDKVITSIFPLNISDDLVEVTVNPSIVTRTNPFSVVVEGRPNTEYILTLMECETGPVELGRCGTLTLDGGDCERPPIIRVDQEGVNKSIFFDDPVGPFTIGDTEFQPNKKLSPPDECCEGYTTIRDLIPTDNKPNAKCVLDNGVYYYAKLITDADGKGTIKFQTDTTNAPDQTWRIHVQSAGTYGGEYTVNDKDVTVNKGTLTISATTSREGGIFLGNDVILTGTSSEAPEGTNDGYVYLFMTGPCQNKCGNDLLALKHADPERGVIKGTPPDCVSGCESCWEGMEEMTLNKVKVDSEGNWNFVWKTEIVPIVPGTYTIYATSKQTSACCLNCDCAAYTSMDVTFLEPYIEAVIDPSEIVRPFNCCPDGCCQDCAVTLSGKAEGNAYVHDYLNGGDIKELNLWIFGQDKVGNQKYVNSKVPLFSKGGFDKVCLPVDICTLEPGDYSIILQHPMYNHQFDIVSEDDLTWMDPTYPLPIDQNRKWMVASYPTEWSKVFPLQGPGYFQGEKARDALLDFLNSGYIDDKYIWLTLKIIDKGQPVADFVGSPQEGVKPLKVTFTDLSTGDNLISWSWIFGDGAISYEQNPVHTYETDGIYTVQLKVTNAEGLSDEVIKTGYITVGEPLIKADFSAYPQIGDAPLEVYFTDLSTGNPNMWFWDFGDGTTSFGIQNPLHIYDYAGTYTVTLTAMRGSESGTKQKENYITVTGIGPTPTITPHPIYDKISLYPGWNMISTPKALAEGYDTAATVFGNVPTGDHAIWEYDSFTNKWVQMEENSVVKPLFGIWIYSTRDYTVPLYFRTETITVPPERNLPAGWSCIGFTGFIPASARDTLLSVYEQWSQTIGWDADYQVYETPMINGGQPPFEDSRYMFPTKGYWLYMSDPGILSALGV
ncbi:MAG: DUF3821 domain-containing protein [Methanospirillaceae archaeon]|nr:DUF3821 domain-containing protein [Methanospirillaceae archaeon]